MERRNRHLLHLLGFLLITGVAWLVLLCLPALPQGWTPITPNMNHYLMRGIQHWWRAVPGLTGGDKLYDLVPGTLDHGVLTSMGFSTTSGWSGTARPGGYAQLNFDGTNDYVQTPTPADLAYNLPFTICLWVYPTAAASGGIPRALLRHSTVNTFSGVVLHWGDNNTGAQVQRPTLGIFSNGITGGQIRVTADRPLNTWEWLCATYDGSQTVAGMGLWANGEALATTTEANTAFGVFTNNPWRFGSDNNATTSSFLQGAMDDVMIWTRALSASELRTLYQVSRAGSQELLPQVPALVAAPLAGATGSFLPFFR